MKRAETYGATRLRPEVIDDYTAVLSLAPDHQKAYRERGLAYTRAKRYPEALADLNEALRLNPMDGTAYWFRSDVYLETGDYDLALEDCEKASQYGWGDVTWRVNKIHEKQAQSRE